MRWRGERQSDNIDDQRGAGGFSGGSPGRMGMGIKAGGVGGFGLIILVILALVFGIDPTTLLQMAPSGQGPSGGQAPSGYSDGGPSSPSVPNNDEMKQFVATVLGNTEDVWNNVFQKMGATYEEPQLVMFSGMVRSACGMAQSASGPFYCPLDHKLYLDTSFFDELDRRFGAPGDFAQAYVIAHEVGHHVQNLLGILPKVEQLKQQVGRSEANALSVRVELQADCFAGVWPIRRSSCARSSKPVTSRKVFEPPAPSATTASRSRPKATWCPMASPTDHRRSAPHGSARGCKVAICVPATPSIRRSCKRRISD